MHQVPTASASQRSFHSQHNEDHANKSKLDTAKDAEAQKRGTLSDCFSAGVLSAKGGNGASTLALNLALAVSRFQKLECTVVDAKLQDPDLVVQLGLQPQHSITEFLSRSLESDESTFEACSLRINETGANCHLMSGTANGESAVESNLSQLSSALPALKKHSEVLLFDLPSNLDRHLVTLLDRLDTIILVFEGTLSSAAAAKRWLRVFAELAYPQSKVLLVHNRSGAKSGAASKDLAHLLGTNELFQTPNSYSFLIDCQEKAKPAILSNPSEKYSKAVAAIAEVLGKLAKTKSQGGQS